MDEDEDDDEEEEEEEEEDDDMEEVCSSFSHATRSEWLYAVSPCRGISGTDYVAL